jgi:hypothetical protein
MRYAVLIQCDESAINGGIAVYAFERPGNLNIAVVDDLTVGL